MDNSSHHIEAIKANNQKEIAKLQRMLHNMHTVANIRFIYDYLKDLKPEPTLEFIMFSEALTTALVVGYGRLFTAANGTTKLNASSVPKHLYPIHEEIMRLRHERYAHHGSHNSMSTEFDIQLEEKSLVVNPRLNFKLCLGAPKEWAPLFEWLDGFMYETSKNQMDYLTQKSGIEWKMPTGPTQPLISEKEN